MNIFFAELHAAAFAIRSAATMAKRAVVLIDNSAVLYALHNGHSSNRTADLIIAQLLSDLPTHFSFAVQHVHSEFNEADVYSREFCGTNSFGEPMMIGSNLG